MPSTHPVALRRLTYALHDGRRTQQALALITAPLELPLLEALADFALSPRAPYKHAIIALEHLAASSHPVARRALIGALTHPLTKLRRTGVDALVARAEEDVAPEFLLRRLSQESSHHVRIGLVALLERRAEPWCWGIVRACGDPHWRVRHAVIGATQRWCAQGDRERVLERLRHEVVAQGVDGARARGLLAYLELYYNEARSVEACAPPTEAPRREPDLSQRPWWNEEPSLVRANLNNLSRKQAREEEGWLVWLLQHPDERVRTRLLALLPSLISPHAVLSFLIMAADPRRPALERTRADFMQRISQDTLEACAWLILEGARAHIPLDALAGIAPAHVDTPWVVEWATRWLQAQLPEDELKQHALLAEAPQPSPLTILCALPWPALAPIPSAAHLHPLAHVRLAALTPERSRIVLNNPEQETSWAVLARAAQLLGEKLADHVPASWMLGPERVITAPKAEEAEREQASFALSTDAAWWQPVGLGATGLKVSRMGISGHYALPERGFACAMDHGINTYFWEPIYQSQTRFFAPMSLQDKSELVMCCGTFEADPRKVRKDVERALKEMNLEQIQVFYIFWVRDVLRLSDELVRELELMRAQGMVHTVGVSTHSRALARTFIQEWPAVMVRHNAAHRGVEDEVLAHVDPQKVGLTTFSNLCYGRMMSQLPGWERGVPSAADAYRYSLSHAGVTSCWSAPGTIAQLEENLSALSMGPMSPGELEQLRDYGRALYRLNTGFTRFVRGR